MSKKLAARKESGPAGTKGFGIGVALPLALTLAGAAQVSAKEPLVDEQTSFRAGALSFLLDVQSPQASQRFDPDRPTNQLMTDPEFKTVQWFNWPNWGNWFNCYDGMWRNC